MRRRADRVCGQPRADRCLPTAAVVAEPSRRRADRTPGNPFAEGAAGADPFAGPASDDPFAKRNTPPTTADESKAQAGTAKRKTLSQQQTRLIEEALQRVEYDLNTSAVDQNAVFLDSALQLLNASLEMDEIREDREPVNVLLRRCT